MDDPAVSIHKNSHVKLIIENTGITPVIDDVTKNKRVIALNFTDGVQFKFQLNQVNDTISYSNFIMYNE